jgi:hypothetical protein
MNVSTLEEYKRELIAEHKAEIAAIDRLIARERRQETPSANGSVVSAGSNTRVRRRLSLATMVGSAIKKMETDFDREMIFQQIQLQAPAFTGTQQKVARELWKRAQDGELKVVSKGAGRIPAIYRKK